MTLNSIVSILIGYCLGSVSPAYFLTKWIKGIDIREVGARYAGTTNVRHNVGLLPAVITGFYDTTKGLVSLFIALHFFNTSENIAYLSGIFAILGHIFPFYIGFRGGKGVAVATGMLILFLGKLTTTSLSPKLILSDLLYLSFLVVSIYLITFDENFLAVVFLPILAALLLVQVPLSGILAFVISLIGFIFTVSAVNIRDMKLLRSKNENIRLWRVMIRPAGMSFPIIGLFTSKAVILNLVGSVLAVSLLADIFRISWKRAGIVLEKEHIKGFKIYKEKEKRRISSITTFLLGVFLAFLLFKFTIAFASIGFLVFGDMMAKIVGINYGKRSLWQYEMSNKTVEGTLGFMMMSISVAYFLWCINFLSLSIGIIGAFTATLTEFLPFPVDDNLSVPIMSGAIMSLANLL
jgi:glycerol-3-phosphate acyltransferase PlsY